MGSAQLFQYLNEEEVLLIRVASYDYSQGGYELVIYGPIEE